MSIHQSSQHLESSELWKTFAARASDYQKAIAELASRVLVAQTLVITTFPRSGTQILQPVQLPEGLLRSYQRDQFINDGPTWQSIRRQAVVADGHCFPGGSLQKSAYFQQWMQPAGLGHVAAAPLAGPLFRGYPGSLHIYRKNGEPAFTSHELEIFGRFASELSHAISRQRAARLETDHGPIAPWEAMGCCRQLIFDGAGKSVNIYHDGQSLDARLMSSIREFVQKSLVKASEMSVSKSERVEFTDSSGEIWVFRVVMYPAFAALGDGPFVFLCLQPPVYEWGTVKPADLQVDPELAKLVSTLSFMRQEFSRMPILGEISGKAHLSPFHFHRRFSELLGQTPKSFQLGCQIHHAKKLLIERKTNLADIAAKCGFAHQSHFTSRFKQATGLTPTRWRRRTAERLEGEESSDRVA
jgi:AraC-like DNA-binding protein